ncbi:MAG TPA: alpha/beta fold hydrolase [Myxococcales bacterium]
MRAILYSPENSTNVRFVSPEAPDLAGEVPERPARPARPVRLPRRGPYPWLRTAFRVASAIAPPLAVRLAERAFGTPPRVEARTSLVLASGHRFYLTAGGERLAIWSWGDGPVALLLHGWGGRSEQLVSFVTPLLAAGYSVLAPDAPGHGSSTGRGSSIVAFADALEAFGARVGPVHAFIGHSGGAAAGALAIHRGLPVRRAVFLAPVASMTDVVMRFSWQLHVPPWIADAMRSRFESRLGVPMSALDVPTLARGASTPLLVFHDPEDREVPWHDAAAIAQAWPGARLVDAPRVGHNRILRDESVIEQAVSFLGAAA